MRQRWTNRPFVDELPDLLRERDLSLRALAREVRVSDAHLSRLLRGVGYRSVPSAELARRIAGALGLPSDYFKEVRQHYILDKVRADAEVCNSVYRLSLIHI